MYLAGMVFFLFKDKIPLKTSLSVASICALAGACFVPGAFDPTFAFAGTYLVFWLGFHPRLRMDHAARFGDFSYGAYLYAFPIQQLITMNFATYLKPYLLLLMATPFTFVAAVLSWYLVERRFLAGLAGLESMRRLLHCLSDHMRVERVLLRSCCFTTFTRIAPSLRGKQAFSLHAGCAAV